MQPEASECQELEDRLVLPSSLDKAWYRILDFVEKQLPDLRSLGIMRNIVRADPLQLI